MLGCQKLVLGNDIAPDVNNGKFCHVETDVDAYYARL
jgi:hypothetical protein